MGVIGTDKENYCEYENKYGSEPGREEKNEERSGQRFASDVTAEELEKARDYLCSYRTGLCMLNCAEYERRYMSGSGGNTGFVCLDGEGKEYSGFDGGDLDGTLLRTRMFGVRSFIESLRCDTETKMVLFWHYIKGRSVSECAELIDISRAGAYRKRKHGLEVAARALRHTVRKTAGQMFI